jgi:arylsulfatase A-like enzyme
VVATLALPSEISGWKLSGSQARVQPPAAQPGDAVGPGGSGGPPRALWIDGLEPGEDREIRVGLAGRFDPREFNRILVRAAAGRDAYVRVMLSRGGTEWTGSRNRERIAASGKRMQPSLAVLDLPSLLRADEPFDELTLVFDGHPGDVELHGLQLVQVPLEAWLPDPEGEAQLTDVGGDLRRAVGLSSERPLEAELVAGPGEELVFAYAQPDEVRALGQSPVLRVTLTCGKATRTDRFALEDDLARPSVWHVEHLSLGDFAGRRVRVGFELRAGKLVPGLEPREALCAISEPWVLRSGEGAFPGRAPAPSVLLVTSDTHRADHLHVSGLGVDVRTPALDALAARGVLFEDCYSSTNVTNPSHIALMTGTSPRDTRIVSNFTPLSPEATTLAERFHDAGWLTLAVVSTPHLGELGSGLGQGFDRMSVPRVAKRRSGETIDVLAGWLEGTGSLPVFAWVHLFDAHTPYEPPSEFEHLYYPEGKDPFDPALPVPRMPAEYRANMPAGLRDLEFQRARYRGEVSSLDRELGRLLGHPRLAGGVVAVTADHGESLGEHGIFWDHADLYPDTIHVPLILAGPGVSSGARVEGPVTQLDLGRTLLDLAGLSESPFPGRSLIAGAGAPPGPSAEPRFLISSHGFRASVTRGGWHLLLTLKKSFVSNGERRVPALVHGVELYDLSQDPHCLKDLAAVEHARAVELRRLLVAWLCSGQDRGWSSPRIQDGDLIEQLAQLGYTSESEPTGAWMDPNCECAVCREFAR